MSFVSLHRNNKKHPDGCFLLFLVYSGSKIQRNSHLCRGDGDSVFLRIKRRFHVRENFLYFFSADFSDWNFRCLCAKHWVTLLNDVYHSIHGTKKRHKKKAAGKPAAKCFTGVILIPTVLPLRTCQAPNPWPFLSSVSL